MHTRHGDSFPGHPCVTPEIMFNFSVGATFRAPYDQEGPIDPTTSQQITRKQRPSDALTLNSSLGYSSGAIYVQVSASWATESDSYVENPPYTALEINGARRQMRRTPGRRRFRRPWPDPGASPR